jgi:hypothetical protein
MHAFVEREKAPPSELMPRINVQCKVRNDGKTSKAPKQPQAPGAGAVYTSQYPPPCTRASLEQFGCVKAGWGRRSRTSALFPSSACATCSSFLHSYVCSAYDHALCWSSFFKNVSQLLGLRVNLAATGLGAVDWHCGQGSCPLLQEGAFAEQLAAVAVAVGAAPLHPCSTCRAIVAA